MMGTAAVTRDEAVEQVKRGLTFRQGTTLDDQIIFELKEAQRRVQYGEAVTASLKRCPLPWFLAEYDSELSLVADTATVSLPTGFIAEMEGDGPYYTKANASYPTHLRKWNPQAPRANAASFTAPSFYRLRKDSIEFFPTPTEALTLYWSYYKEDSALDTNIENNWLKYAPTVLIGLAGVEIAADAKNAGAVEKFSAMYTRGIDAIEVQNFRREHSNHRSQMGEG
jgi:hypothetical protein